MENPAQIIERERYLRLVYDMEYLSREQVTATVRSAYQNGLVSEGYMRAATWSIPVGSKPAVYRRFFRWMTGEGSMPSMNPTNAEAARRLVQLPWPSCISTRLGAIAYHNLDTPEADPAPTSDLALDDEPHVVYVLRHDLHWIVKVGVTVERSNRLAAWRRRGWWLHSHIDVDDRADAFAIEAEMLGELRDVSDPIPAEYMPGGYEGHTETFVLNPVVHDIIEGWAA